MPDDRRIVAIVLLQLACEIAREESHVREGMPLAVVFSETEEDASAAAEVGAVCERARSRGVRPGMSVAEAMARSAELTFARVSPRSLVQALGAVAEVAMEFGIAVEIARSAPLDTVWVDVTGSAHLFGGEAALCDEIESRVATLGYRANVSVAGGPSLARAFARFAAHASPCDGGIGRICPPGEDKHFVLRLPISALPLPERAATYFIRLGVVGVADLAKLDRSQLTSRLEAFVDAASVRDVLDWLDGKDTRPLAPYLAPEVLVEELSFEDGVETAPQLVFALRHAVSKLSSRLTGRRQATNRIDLEIAYDRTIFRLRTGEISPECSVGLWVDLPAPLSHTDDLFRALKAKIERLELAAPAVRIVLRLSRVVRAHEVQLDLSRDVSVSPDALPALLSELSAEIGIERVGVLSVVDDLRPEKRTRLSGINYGGINDGKNRRSETMPLFARLEPGEPTRLLPEPALLFRRGGGRLEPGASLYIGRQAFVVKKVAFDRRLDGALWWSDTPCSRDYLRVTLHGLSCSTQAMGDDGVRAGGAEGVAEAWVYVDRDTGETMLQGWWE